MMPPHPTMMPGTRRTPRTAAAIRALALFLLLAPGSDSVGAPPATAAAAASAEDVPRSLDAAVDETLERVRAESARANIGRRLSSQTAWSRQAPPPGRAMALAIMLASSMNVSRTIVTGRRFMASPDASHAAIQDAAGRNFRAAAELVVDRARELPVERATAVVLNRMLTAGLVPEVKRGDPDFRRSSKEFYAWLDSEEARRLGEDDPVALAERIHFETCRLDSFADGNGRTGRLLADLVLLRRGLPPAFYTDMPDYFARGTCRSKAPRPALQAYFREVAARGRAAVEDPGKFQDMAPALGPEDAEFLRKISSQAGHEGVPQSAPSPPDDGGS